jgi:nucleoside-diphosphate kinase
MPSRLDDVGTHSNPQEYMLTSLALLGATNPLASQPGTIRGDFAIDVGRNVCHGSDSVENAKKEIALWFKEGEVQSWKSAQHDWVYEK